MSSPGVDASDAEGEKTGGAGTSRGSCDARGCSDDGDEPLKTSSTAELAAIFGAASATLGTASMKLLTACGLLLALSPMKLTTAPPPELG